MQKFLAVHKRYHWHPNLLKKIKKIKIFLHIKFHLTMKTYTVARAGEAEKAIACQVLKIWVKSKF